MTRRKRSERKTTITPYFLLRGMNTEKKRTHLEADVFNGTSKVALTGIDNVERAYRQGDADREMLEEIAEKATHSQYETVKDRAEAILSEEIQYGSYGD